MPDIYFIAQDICKDDFCHISVKRLRNKKIQNQIARTFSFGIHPNYHLDIIASIYCLQTRINLKAGTFELLSDIGHFLVDPLFFQFLHSCTSNVRNKLEK